MDEIRYFDLESLIFEGEYSISNKYHKQEYLNGEDFFCILIWKANRAKRYHATRFIKIAEKKGWDLNLDTISVKITKHVYSIKDDKERFRILGEDYGFFLPTLSTILTVLEPEKFSIFDYRVCETLSKRFMQKEYKNISSWDNYLEYVECIKKCVPQYSNLRDKDRFLWGCSFYEDLKLGLSNNFIVEDQKKNHKA
jgi:hypothetical protein